MDCYIENNCIKCVYCRGCSAICPTRNAYVTEFENDGRKTHHLHVRNREKCKKCSKGVDKTPCEEICPEQCIKIEWR